MKNLSNYQATEICNASARKLEELEAQLPSDCVVTLFITFENDTGSVMVSRIDDLEKGLQEIRNNITKKLNELRAPTGAVIILEETATEDSKCNDCIAHGICYAMLGSEQCIGFNRSADELVRTAQHDDHVGNRAAPPLSQENDAQDG